MGKQKDYTPEELREMEAMRAFYEQNKDPLTNQIKKSSTDFTGNVVSTRDIINSENSLEEFNQIEEKKKRLEQEQEKYQGHLMGVANAYKKISEDKKEAKNRAEVKEDEPVTKDELLDTIKKNNREIELKNMGELEKMYYTELEPGTYEEKRKVQDRIDELKNNEDSYEMVEYMTKTPDGGFDYKTRRMLKPSVKAEIEKLNQNYNEITKPVNKKFKEIIEAKLEGAKGKQKDENVSYWSSEYSTEHLSEVFYEKALDIVNSNVNDSGFWKSVVDGVSDEDFYTLGTASLEANIRLVKIANKMDNNEELSDSDVRLLDAYNTYNEALSNVSVGGNYTVGQGVTQSIPWMIQFGATRGIGTSMEKGVEMALKKATKKYLNKNLKSTIARKATDITSKVLATSAGVYTQAAMMPQTYGDIADRYHGELQVTRDNEGKIDGYYMRDKLQQKVTNEQKAKIQEIKDDPNSYDENGNLTSTAQESIQDAEDTINKSAPSSILGASYKGLTNSAIEALTERVGGEFIVNKFKKLGIKADFLPRGKYTEKFNTFKNAIGWNGIAPEYLEEAMNVPLNAFFVGDSNYSDLWDGQQQLHTLMQVAITGAGMSIGHQGLNLPSRIKNKEFYKERKKMIQKFNELKSANPNELDNIMSLSTNSSDLISMKEKERELRKEGKDKEADAVGERILYNQMMKAFDTGTVDQFEEALSDLSVNPEAPEGVRTNATQAKIDLQALKRTYEKFGKLKNSATIMRLQANKIMARRASQGLEMQIQDLENDVVEDIKAYASENKIELPDFNINNLFTQEFEDKTENDKYQMFLDKIRKSNLLSVSQLETLQTAKSVIDQMGQEQRLLFNEQISPEFQNKMEDEFKLKSKLNSNKAFNKAIEENDLDAYTEEFNKIASKYKGNLSKKRVEEIKSELDQLIGMKKLQEEIEKQASIKQKIEETKAEETSNIEPNKETNKEEVIEDAQTDEINQALDQDFTREAENLSKESMQVNKEGGLQISPENPNFFDLPKDLNDNLSEEQKNSMKGRISSMYDILKNQLDRNPTFEDLVNKFIDSTSVKQAEEFYNVLATGWQLNEYSKTDFKQTYDKIFDPFKSIANEVVGDTSVFGPETKTELDVEVDKQLKKAEKKSSPIVNFSPENVPVRKTEGMKTVTSQLKLGFLALNYVEEVNEQGVLENRTIGTNLNEDGIIDFKDLLNPDKYNSGSQLFVSVPPEETLSQIYITDRDENGNKTSQLFNDWLSKKLKENPDFRETDEYISRVPILTYSKEGKPLAYIHDVEWYNPWNVGYSENPPLQAEIIEDGRKEVFELRKQIVSNGLKTVRIKSKEGETFHKIPKSQPTISITEANPQAEIAVAKNRGQLYQGVQAFETDKRIITNKDDIVEGHSYDLRRMGTDAKGRQTWRAFPLLRGDEANDYKLDNETYQTVKWAFASYLKLQTPQLNSYFKNKEFQISEEQAKKIADAIFSETGYDISSRSDLRDFLRLHIYVKDLDYLTLANKLFSDNIEDGKDFKQHTSNEGIGINPNMVTISEEGEVKPTGKKYREHLKDVLRTNVKSFNVGTQENPVYATVVQPKIYYGYDDETSVNPSLREQVEEVAKEIKEELQQDNTPSSIETKGWDVLNKLGFSSNQQSFDLPTQITDTTIIESIFNTTEGLSVIQEYQLIDFIFNRISNNIGIEKDSSIDKEMLLAKIKNSYNEIIKPSRAEVEGILKQIKELHASNPEKYSNLTNLIVEYEKAISIYDNIKNSWSAIEEKALNKLYKYTGIREGQNTEDTNKSLRQKDYSKTSLEENGKSKTSYRLRRFFAGIEQKTPQGETKKGFLNLPTYVGFNDVYNTIAQILSSPVEIESDFDLMIEKLNQAKETHKWIPEVIERLKNADEQIKKEFTYNYTKHTLSMKFAMYSEDGNGNYSLKVYDTNANEITRLIRDTWKSNFIIGPLVNSNQEFYSINKVKAKQLLDEFESWGDQKSNVNKDIVRQWLANFGIVMSKDAFNELSEKGIYYNGENIDYSDMFDGNDTVFGLLHKYLKHIVTVENTEFEENENNHPFTDMQGVLQTLSMLESKYTNQSMTLSFRDNGKSIFGLTPNKFATDRILALKQYDDEGNNEFVSNLLSLSMSSDSVLLNLLELEESFRGKLSIDHIGITSLKQLGKKASPFSNITDLSSIDHDVAKMTGFQDTKQGTVTASVDNNGNLVAQGNGISMRMARMFLPTMSDKSQMLMLNTGVFNFLKDKRKAFNISSEGDVGFTSVMEKLLFNQLVKPELKRIVKFHSKVYDTNIKDYDLAAQIFNFIPELNNIKDENGVRMIELIASDPETFNVEKIQQMFGTEINKVVKTIIDKKVSSKLKLWETAVTRDDKDNIEAVKFFDSTYLSQGSGTIEEKYKVGMYDFVINSFITNANMFTTIAGDPAIYSQDKLFKNFGVDNIAISQLASLYGKEGVFKLYGTHSSFLKDLDRVYSEGLISKSLYDDMKAKIKPSPFSANDEAYTSLSKAIGVNIGKRLALLIAPGNKIADSKHEKYMQVFLNDAVHMSENIEYLIELYYGKESLDSVQDTINRYRTSEKETEKASIRKELSDKFPSLSDYFDIESTDAQEYTTVKEHLIVLNGQGRLTDAQVDQINQKLAEGKDLDKKELDLVLQPIKPVHTGQIIDKEQDVLRTVYIKSSSFPLLPQLTKGRNLDKLRVKLEQLELDNQMPVRASYQTANKVGALNNPINPFNDEELENIEASSLVLDRNNFRIQQDVPFKSDLKKEDKVSMGTQIFKLLFGDGMMDLDGFELNGKTMTGKELYDYFNSTFSSLIQLKKKGLYKELGLDSNGVPIDQRKSMEKLQDLLQREANERGYPRQDIEGLTFVEKVDINGNTYYDFKLPLWISSNSNRYEALLNAIVTNRLISQKMPGNSFVVGSEEGFTVKEDMEGIEQSRVIHVGDYQGGELKGVQRADGTFHFAQVLVPSKFKNSKGDLIDLFEKVNGKYRYLIEEKGQPLKLNQEMIDPELLNNFSFRTPTSSHVSASIIQIAGILPPESGDLMIVPKNFTKQKGLDYDVDKETAYQLWHIRDSRTGEIKVVSEEIRDKVLSKLKTRLENKQVDDAYDRIMRALFSEAYDDALVDEVSSIEDKIDSLTDKFNQKILENEFIKVHMSVFSNPNPEVQKKINKVLSMDFARSQADFIENLSTTNVDESDFTILSDEYQKEKMGLGAAGKLAIGVYSNYVTFHGLSQQIERPVQLMEETEEDTFTNKTFRIGNFKSEGVIGLLNTLDGSRSIAEAFAERQNTATDNEKEQILGRVNINSHTINVDSLLTLLGFDKGETVDGQETSIPYLFLSQPIIKDYVALMQDSQAITSEYNFNKEAEILSKLINKYSKGFKLDDSAEILNEEQFNTLIKDLTSENMIEAIKGNNNNPGLQLAVLQQFLELDKYAKQIGSLQGVLNTTNLGKSIIESNEKYDKLSKLKDNALIKNGEKLIGDYIPVNEYSNQEGYMRVGDYYIKPMTPQGQIVVNGIKTGNDLWNEYFPYSDENIKVVMKEILEITDGSEKSDSRKIEMKFDIFKEIKKYINSHNRNGLFSDKASVERERLFIDSKDNTSLATYLNKLKINDLSIFDKTDKPGIFNLKSNKLFSKFEFNLNTNGEPSTIRYNNTSSENFDEDYLYTAIAEMVINQEKLPDYNGQPYDTRKLASDLVAYTYLEGGVQEAIQFVKYVPIEYLETVGFTTTLQGYSPKRDGSVFKHILGIKELNDLNQHETHKFVKQYIQHNPQMARQFPKEEEAKLFQKKVFNPKTKIMESFELQQEEQPKFITRKNRTKSKRLQDKFSLYQNMGNGKYQRISILGTHGMNEYELGNDNAVSLIDKAEPFVYTPNVQRVNQNPSKQPNDRFDLMSGNAAQILAKIGNYKTVKYKHFGKLAEFLAPFVKENLEVKVMDTEKDNGIKASGRTTLNEDGSITIIIDSDLFASNNQEQIARTFIHEFVHSVTFSELNKYFDFDGKQKVKDLPLHVSRLVRVFNETKKHLEPELKALLEKRRQHLEGTLPSNTVYKAEELEITYGATSIFEFVTTALTEPAFQKKMNEIEFKKSGQSIWERFKEAVMNILFSNNIGIKKDSVTYEALSSTLEFIDIENNINSNKNSTFEQSKQSDVTLKDIQEQIKGIQDSETDSINNILGLNDRGIEDSETDAINNALDLPMEAIKELPDICL